eukprot:3937240-Rhodomonas_salina.1
MTDSDRNARKGTVMLRACRTSPEKEDVSDTATSTKESGCCPLKYFASSDQTVKSGVSVLMKAYQASITCE